jgi:hypothetical protein
MKRFGLVLVAVGFSLGLFAQDWVEGMQDNNVSVYQVQKDFEKYWRKVKRQAERTNENFRPGKSGLAFGYPQFKRWENYWLPRVSGTDGMRPDGAWLAQTMLAAKTGAAAAQNAGDWQPIGPFNAPNMNGNGWTGIGRVNCVAFHPTNTNIIWAGTPAGGLWKSTDGGQSWTTNTDDLPHLGIASIAIDPQHPDTMYVATGDRNASNTPSYGILKSVDGGQTWSIINKNSLPGTPGKFGELWVVPDSTNIVIAATHGGILRSTDYGDTWSGIQGGSTFNMLAPDPQNPHIIFAGTSGGGEIWRSTNRGLSWSPLSTGLPTSGVSRVEIAVSPQDSNYVYAVFSNNGNTNNGTNGFGGLYRSTNGGNTWTLRSSTPNILGWSANGTGSGGQGWYDLCIAVSPTNKNTIFVGGVNVWRNNAGGNSQQLELCWPLVWSKWCSDCSCRYSLLQLATGHKSFVVGHRWRCIQNHQFG